MQLIDILKSKIESHGPMPFVEFMQEALYSPYGGYYTSKRTILGEGGDFITAPELTPLYGYTLAEQCKPILKQYKAPCILEFGAGTGQLCTDILTHLKCEDALPEKYYILELSAVLKAQQQQKIQTQLPELFNSIEWLDSWPKGAFEGIIIANEVLDAMPVHRFLQTETEILESYIALTANKEFYETFLNAHENLRNYVTQVLPKDFFPYQSEANLLIPGWISECAQCLARGVMFIIDYGFARDEYYHPDRSTGTLMCHYQHKAHTNPLIHIGEQDITAHVDFTHVAEVATDADFNVAGFTHQAAFLISSGLLQLLEKDSSPQKIQAVKKLLDPSEMGELFKVMALSKNFADPLSGFQMVDRRIKL